jgi:hypothetical protein
MSKSHNFSSDVPTRQRGRAGTIVMAKDFAAGGRVSRVLILYVRDDFSIPTIQETREQQTATKTQEEAVHSTR